jgi:hypothetical protein
MENPDSWGPIQKLIWDTIIEHEKELAAKEFIGGPSLPTRIYYALKDADCLLEDKPHEE